MADSTAPSSSVLPRKAVVIGAGLAGLAAAIRLKERGVEQVTVLESAERPGGLAVTLRYDGAATDIGPHRLYTEIPEIERLYREIGGEALLEVKRKSSMFLNGRLIEYPITLKALLRGPGPLRLAHFGLSWGCTRVAAAFGALDRSTFDGHMRLAFGSALYRYLLGPYSEKVWKADPRLLDADAARVRVSAGSLARMVRRVFVRREKKGAETSLDRFLYLKGGAQTLVDRFAQRAAALGARILLRHEVDSLEIERSRIVSVGARTPEGPRRFAADIVVSTAPLPRLVEWIDQAWPLPFNVTEAAKTLRYLDLILVSLVVDRDLITGDQWIYFPSSGFVFNRVSEPKAFDPQMAPPGRSILSADITCRPGQDLWGEPDEKIAAAVEDGMARAGLIQRREVLQRHVHRVRNAYPVYHFGYGKKTDTTLDGLARVANLVTTGRQGLFNFNNMDHTIFMGLRAADCAALSPRPAEVWLGDNEVFRSLRIVD